MWEPHPKDALVEYDENNAPVLNGLQMLVSNNTYMVKQLYYHKLQ